MAAVAPQMRHEAGEQSLPFVGIESPNGGSSKLQLQGVEDIALCASPGPVLAPKKKRRSKKERSTLGKASQWVVENQIGISIAFFVALYLTDRFVPSLRWETEKFFALNYFNPRTARYGAGWDDMFFVTYWIMVFTGVRVAFMEYLAAPLAKRANITGRKDQVRMAEQAWIFVYYLGSWSLGTYITYNSEYWFNLDEMWTNWPDREMDGIMKWYYLVQFSFWLQQIVVVNIEERRKDHWQMFTHHIVTCALLFSSYAYHYTKVGNVILVLMDFVDFILPLAKMLRYLGFQFACDCAFGVFIVGWIITRHIFYMMVCWSVHVGTRRNIGCFYGSNDNLVGPTEPPNDLIHLLEPFKDPEGLICTTDAMVNSFLILLLFLQGILLLWFTLIVRLAVKVIFGGGNAEDPRSDEEEVEEEEIESDVSSPSVNGGLLQEEVGVEQMHFRSKPVTRSKAGGRTTGVALPVKKELLNRVGCETKTSES